MLYEGGHTNRSGRGKFPVTAHHTHSKIWLLQFQQNLMVLQDPSEEDQESIQDSFEEDQESILQDSSEEDQGSILQDSSEEDQGNVLQDPSVEGQEGLADQIICRLYV